MGTSQMPSLNRFLPENTSEVSSDLRPFLSVAIQDVGALGPQFAKEYKRLLVLERLVEKDRFRLAVLSPPGTGKSTITNAFLGVDLLIYCRISDCMDGNG